MPPTSQTAEDARHTARARDDAERARHDAALREEVRTLEATVQAMWDLLGGKEERDDASSLSESR